MRERKLPNIGLGIQAGMYTGIHSAAKPASIKWLGTMKKPGTRQRMRRRDQRR